VSRLIKTGSAGKDRQLLEKGITLAIRELAAQEGLDNTTLDLLAYISLSLLAVGETIEQSVAAWEKRDYWIKADRYRMEWSWAGNWGQAMKDAIIREDWASVAKITAQVTAKMSKVKVAQRNRLGKPWVGSYQKLVSPN
jgi:sensor domain CHASE-containing protein